MHVNDLDDDYLPLGARIEDGMFLLCLHTTAANASDVLPPPKNCKDIHGRPDEEECHPACIEEFKGKVANNTFDLVNRPKNTLVDKTKQQRRHSQTTQSALGTLRLQSTTWSSFRQDLHGNPHLLCARCALRP
eukprot:639086-Pleurochrysis_carterae.AAC.1